MLSAAACAPARVVFDGRQAAAGLRAGRGRSRSRCSRWRRRSRARASRRSTRPSRAETAVLLGDGELILVGALICARSFGDVGRHGRRGGAAPGTGRTPAADACGEPATAQTATRRTTQLRVTQPFVQPVVAVARRVGDAVGNADAAKAAAGDEQARMSRRARRRSPRCASSGRLRAARWRARTGRRASSSGSPVMPSSGRSAASDRATSSRVGPLERVRDRARRRRTRAAARDPSGARCGHFDDSHDAARMPVPSDARHDEAGAVQRMRHGVAREGERDVAVDAYGISAHRPRELGVVLAQRASAVDVRRRRRATTARASNVSPRGVSTRNGRAPSTRRSRPACSSRTASGGSARDERAHHLAQAAGQRSERAVGATPASELPGGTRAAGCRASARPRRSAETARAIDSRSTSPA